MTVGEGSWEGFGTTEEMKSLLGTPFKAEKGGSIGKEGGRGKEGSFSVFHFPSGTCHCSVDKEG